MLPPVPLRKQNPRFWLGSNSRFLEVISWLNISKKIYKKTILGKTIYFCPPEDIDCPLGIRDCLGFPQRSFWHFLFLVPVPRKILPPQRKRC